MMGPSDRSRASLPSAPAWRPLYRWIAAHVIRFPGPFAAIHLVALAVSTAGLARLGVEFPIHGIATLSGRLQSDYREFVDQWGRDDHDLLVVVESDSGDILAPEQSSRLDNLSAALARVPGVKRARSPGDLLRIAAALGPGPAHPASGVGPPCRMPGRGLQREDLVPRLVSPDGTTAAIWVELDDDMGRLETLVSVTARVRAVIAQMPDHAGLRFSCAGIPVARADYVMALQRDQMVFGVLGAVFLVALLWLWFRSLHGVLVPIGLALTSTVELFGAMGLAGSALEVLNQSLLPLLPAVSVATAVYVVSRFDQRRARRENRRPSSSAGADTAAVDALGDLGWTAFFSTFTTAAGFASLVVWGSGPIRQFGLWGMLGCAIVHLNTATLAPLLLRIFAREHRPERTDGLRWAARRTLAAAYTRSSARPGWVVAAALALVGLGAVAATRLTENHRLADAVGLTHPTTAANDIVDRQLGGVLALELDLTSPGRRLGDGSVLEEMRGVERALASLPGVRNIVGPGLVVERMNRSFGSGEERIPEDPASIETLLHLTAMMKQSGQWSDAVGQRARIEVRTADRGSAEFRALARRAQAIAVERLAPLGIDVRPTGDVFVVFESLSDLSHQLLLGLGGEILFGYAVFSVLVRNFRLAVIGVFVNLVPLSAILMTLWVAGIDFGIVPAMLLTIVFGIVMEDTIHFLFRFVSRRASRNPAEVVVATYRDVAFPATVSAVALSVGLGVNLASSFPHGRTMGLLGMTGIVGGVLADLCLCPALLLTFAGGRGGPEGAAPPARRTQGPSQLDLPREASCLLSRHKSIVGTRSPTIGALHGGTQ
jgi:predicted RND superfamily exporter protein